MDKRLVIFLFENNWSQAKIARRFKVSRARICQIVRLVKTREDEFDEDKCEICGGSIEKEQYIKIKGVKGADPLLACDKCKNII